MPVAILSRLLAGVDGIFDRSQAVFNLFNPLKYFFGSAFNAENNKWQYEPNNCQKKSGHPE